MDTLHPHLWPGGTQKCLWGRLWAQGGFLNPCREGQKHRGSAWLCTFPGMPGMSLFACGEAWENKYFSFFLCQDKQTMELIGGWRKLGRFCFNYDRAVVRARISCHGVRKFPGSALGSVQAGSAWDVLHKELKTSTAGSWSACSQWLSPELLANVHKLFFEGHSEQMTLQSSQLSGFSAPLFLQPLFALSEI